jgi:hypothetical protein
MNHKLAVLLALSPALALSAHAEDRIRLIVNGGWTSKSSNLSESRPYTEFAETGSLGADYSLKSGFTFDGGVQVQIVRNLGVYAAFSSASADETGQFKASLPHPLYLNRPRSLEGELSGLSSKENVFHLDLSIGRGQGHWDYAVFAGASLFSVETSVLDTLRYAQSYPYDTVTLTSAAGKTVKDSPIGFNAGGRLDYRFGAAKKVGFGAQVRFSSATAKLPTADGKTLSLDAGGFSGGLGLRLYF